MDERGMFVRIAYLICEKCENTLFRNRGAMGFMFLNARRKRRERIEGAFQTTWNVYNFAL